MDAESPHPPPPMIRTGTSLTVMFGLPLGVYGAGALLKAGDSVEGDGWGVGGDVVVDGPVGPSPQLVAVLADDPALVVELEDVHDAEADPGAAGQWAAGHVVLDVPDERHVRDGVVDHVVVGGEPADGRHRVDLVALEHLQVGGLHRRLVPQEDTAGRHLPDDRVAVQIDRLVDVLRVLVVEVGVYRRQVAGHDLFRGEGGRGHGDSLVRGMVGVTLVSYM